MRIEQLGPPNADHSTGLILRWRGKLLFALEPRRNWRDHDGTPLARFVGIGGHLETDETWVQAVRREALEEAGLEVTLLASQTTALLRDDGTIVDLSTSLDWPDPPRPLFIWSAHYRFGRPPHEQVRHFVNPVFLAAAPDEVEPRPAAEVEAILAISEGQLCRTAECPTPLGDLLDGGAMIWAATPLPRSTLLAPGGSAQWYAVLGNTP